MKDKKEMYPYYKTHSHTQTQDTLQMKHASVLLKS